MTLLSITPGDAGLLAIAARRMGQAFAAVGNLPAGPRRAADDLARLAAQLEDAAKSGHDLALFVEVGDTGPRNVRVSQAACMALVSERSLRRRLAAGTIPSTRDGRGYLVPLDELVEWIRAGRPSDRAA